MSTSRRDFLKKGSLVALVAGVPLSLAERVLGNEPLASSAGLGLSKAAFMAQLNTEFLINEQNAKRKVKLVAVEDLLQTNQFRVDQTTTLKQDTYLIEHARLGAFSFLLVPVRTADKKMLHYEAIINHLHP